ncbi:MAG: hypothetical protein PHP23_13405 [Desulfobacterales bacterium]|nr:hypothetical protein [Desulfobacterales bacterium]MDD4072903.1 hypothetical protein [Desulfobacterales bacterium]MDD4393739.1 hypothetical protein [Desulfobacterales bacterium]
MANPDFVKMISLGKWLEKFLDDDIRPWQFLELAREAVVLLSAEYEVNPNNGFLKDIDLVKPQNNENFIEALKRSLKEKKDNNETKLDTIKRIGSKSYESGLKKGIDFSKTILLDRWLEWRQLLLFRLNVIVLFEEINKSDLLWDQVIPKIQEGKHNIPDKPNGSGLGLCYSNRTVEYLIAKYSQQSETFLKQKDGRLKKQIAYVFTHPFRGSDPSEHFPLDIMLSRIFFDFLLLGGQDYYGFCDYCGKFYVVQRKGRKRFCSDICRTANQKKPLKE